MWMLLGVVCGQSHFVPLRLWSIDVYHLVLFLSADSSTGFGSQLEEIVTQGAMLESQYETPTCNLLVHYLHPFLFSTWKGETCHDSNGIFMGSCMHMWSYHPNACMGLPWSLSVLLESKVLMCGRKIWWGYINGIVCVCVCFDAYAMQYHAIYSSHIAAVLVLFCFQVSFDC